MKRYPNYKDSGVEWLGDIPEHWEVKRLKFIAKIKTGEKDTIDKEENGKYPFFVRSQTVEKLNTYSYDEEAVLTAGDGVGVGKVFHYINGKFEYHQRVYKISDFQEISGKYFFYYIKNNLYAEVIKISAKSTVDSLRLPMFLNFPVSIPTLSEQKAITRFLDRKLEQIDHFISNKQRLIELLKEQKTAIVNRAVTKGLNPHTPMKHSGIEWLGEIPAHWETLPIKRIARPGYKTFTDGDWIELPYITEKGVRLIQTGNIGIGIYREQGFRYISEASFYSLKCKEIQPNDILICRLDGPVGRACLAPDLGVKMITSVDNAILKPDVKHDPQYLVYFMSSKSYLEWNQTISRVGGGHRWRISRSMLGELRIPVPPTQEQVSIVQYIGQESEKIQQVIAKAEKEIELIQEYRTTLISDAVTGKIDVRETSAVETTLTTAAI